MVARAPPPGPRRRPQLSRAADPVRRLRRPRQGRARPGHDDRQDDERRTTSSSSPPRELTAEQRTAWDAYYEPRNDGLPRRRTSRARTWCAGSTTAICTTTWAASRPSTRASAGCSKYLDDEGLADDTIVVYASDQGFYLGEHGWFDKRWIFEESLRTPLLVRWPGVVKPGSVDARIVSNLDFAETFLEAAGRRRSRRDAGAEPRAAARRARTPPTGGRASTTTITSTPAPTTSAATTAS